MALNAQRTPDARTRRVQADLFTWTPDDIVAERKLNDGSRYSIYKIFYDPPRLQARLEALGWRAAVTSTESFFVYGECEA